MEKEFLYYVYSNKTKVGEQLIGFKEYDDVLCLTSQVDLQSAREIIETRMDKIDYSPKKISVSCNYDNKDINAAVEFTGKGKISLDGGKQSIYFKGNIFDNLQVSFILPQIFDKMDVFLTNRKWVTVFIPNTFDVMNFLIAKRDTQTKKDPEYEISTPISMLFEFDKEDSFLLQSYNALSGLEIRRV